MCVCIYISIYIYTKFLKSGRHVTHSAGPATHVGMAQRATRSAQAQRGRHFEGADRKLAPAQDVSGCIAVKDVTRPHGTRRGRWRVPSPPSASMSSACPFPAKRNN